MNTMNTQKENNMKIKMNGKIVVALVMAVFMMVGVSSQSQAAFSEKDAGTASGQFLKLPVGARYIGMGETGSALSSDASAIYYNPAGIANLDKKSVEYMYSRYVEETSYHWIAYAMPISENLGSAGIGIQYFTAGDLDETDIRSSKVGSFSPSDLAVNLSYARKIFGEANSVGLNLKIINSKIKESATAFAVDLGAQNKSLLNGKLSLGLSILNLGSKLKFEQESEKLPLMIRLGSGYSISENFLATTDLVFPEDSDPFVGFGGEYRLALQNDMALAGRAGYNSQARKVDGLNGITVGFGFGFRNYSLDYAWKPLGDLGSTHRVSLGAKF